MTKNRFFDLQIFADDGDPNAGGDNGDNGGNAGKTFTQADVDRIVAERLAREKEKYKDYADLKAKAAKLAELEQSQLTEQEKLQAKLKQLEQEKTEALTAANQRLLAAEVKLQAAELGIIDPDAAFALMSRDGVEVTADGAVKGVKEALTALLEVKPYLKKPDGGGAAGGQDFGEGNKHKSEIEKLQEEMEKATKLDAKLAIKNKIFALQQMKG